MHGRTYRHHGDLGHDCLATWAISAPTKGLEAALASRDSRKTIASVIDLPKVRIPLIVTDDSGIVTGHSGDRDRRYETVRHSAL